MKYSTLSCYNFHLQVNLKTSKIRHSWQDSFFVLKVHLFFERKYPKKILLRCNMAHPFPNFAP